MANAMEPRSLMRPPPVQDLPPLRATRLLDQVRERIRYLHYSRRTEKAYVHWIRGFIRFHGLRHPAQMGQAEVESFLSWLASERDVSASTHTQALSALLFLYGKVLGQTLPWMQEVGRPRRQRRLPAVLSKPQVAAIFSRMSGEHLLFAQLLYGAGPRSGRWGALRSEIKEEVGRSPAGGHSRSRAPRRPDPAPALAVDGREPGTHGQARSAG